MSSRSKCKSTPKICVVSSCGGHLTEVRCFLGAYQNLEHFYILNDKAILPDDMVGRTRFIVHAERNFKVLWNFYEAYRILRKEKPTMILSTGAGPVVPFALIGRWFFGCRITFIETLTRVQRPSLTGRLIYRLSHDFFYQWESLRKFFPKGTYGGPLI